MIIPSANSEEYYFWRTMRGIWPRVQESQVYGVGANMVGHFMGITFTGRSCLLAPLELTPNQDGFIARAKTFDSEEIVVGEFDYERLHAFRRQNPLEFNEDLYAKYLPSLYEEAQARRNAGEI